jgi:hypothetical protein
LNRKSGTDKFQIRILKEEDAMAILKPNAGNDEAKDGEDEALD